jgi:hypothetical protein
MHVSSPPNNPSYILPISRCDLEVTDVAQRLSREWLMAQRLSRSVRMQQQEYEETVAQLESMIVAQVQ